MWDEIVKRIRAAVAFGAVFISATGCVSAWREKVDPHTNLQIPDRFAGVQNSDETAEKNAQRENPAQTVAGSWWKMFGDARLEAYLASVIEGNLSFQRAVAQLRQIEALHGIRFADLLPQLSLGVEVARTRTDTDVPALEATAAGPRFTQKETTLHQTLSQFSLNLGYELDLFGRATAETQAVAEQYRSSVFGLVAGTQQVLVEAMNAYFSAIESDLQRQLLEQNLSNAREYLALVERRFALGRAEVLDVNQARDALLNVQTQVPLLENAQDAARARLALLTGLPHRSREVTLAAAFPAETGAFDFAAPVAVVQTRADVLASLHRVYQADREAAAALAARFPRISFSARIGYPAESLREVFSPERLFWQLVGNLTAPLFSGGRLKAAQEAKEAAVAERVLDYREKVVQAVTDVERSLKTLATTRERLRLTRSLVRNARLTADLAGEKYRQGLAPFLNVLAAQQAAFQTERSLISLQREELSAFVSLVHITGGLWLPGEVVARARDAGLSFDVDSSEAPKTEP